MNIVLIGMKHCGKSTLGTALAARWGCPFYDIDNLIENHHHCETGQRLSFREIFASRGEDYFHEVESKVVCELYLRLSDAKTPNVVSVGGRTALNPKVRELLSGIGMIVYLEVSADELLARVTKAGLPPFVDDKDPEGHFKELYNERAPHYQEIAQITVNLDRLAPEAALEKVCQALVQKDVSVQG